jgi:hypothetical protein
MHIPRLNPSIHSDPSHDDLWSAQAKRYYRLGPKTVSVQSGTTEVSYQDLVSGERVIGA